MWEMTFVFSVVSSRLTKRTQVTPTAGYMSDARPTESPDDTGEFAIRG